MKNDYDAPEGEAFDEIYQSDGLRWMSIVVVLLVVFGFFSLAWYAYRTNTRPTTEDGEMLVVEGDTSEYKERPENPGGMEFPHQDKEVYNRLVAADEKSMGDQPVERLMPAAEEPIIERQTTDESGKEATGWINDKLHPTADESSSLKEEKTEMIAAEPEKASPQKSEEKQKAVAEEARKEEVKAQGEIPAYVPPKPVVKPWVPVERPGQEKAPVEVKKEVEVQKETVTPPHPQNDPIVAQAEKFAQEKPALPEVKKTVPPAAVTPPAAGAIEVQLAALRSRAEAETVWNGLAARHRDVLGGKSHRIVTVDIPGKGTYYRLRVSAASASAANSLCTTLNQRSQACILVH